MNIREIAGSNRNYFEINREERNYAAILYAALCIPGNAEKFLESCGLSTKLDPEFSIYFEYAFLRDLWDSISNDETKINIIRKLLKIRGIREILELPVRDMNQRFGASGTGLSDKIQFPGKWAISKYHKNFESDIDFVRVCKFKWSFNIKPDIVIHRDKDNAVCIEAKYQSREGSYPSSPKDKHIFTARGLPKIGQTEVQKYMMEELLGVETEFIFLVSKKESSRTHDVVTWWDAFANLDMIEMSVFARKMAEQISDS
ncbi:MAG: hypothetical protein ACC700_15665 [Anaerolineales bacterium]